MNIEILTIFPESFDSPLKSSLMGKACDSGLLTISTTDIRDFSTDKHRTVDDTPFGGGAGMVMKVEPLDIAITHILNKYAGVKPKILLTSASGNKFNQKKAEELAREELLIIICGRYKGIDERLLSLYDIDQISIGDYVLNGGETAALVIAEATARLIPGYMGKLEAAEDDSFAWGILGYPVYTQPQEYKGLKVPDVLVSGHHAKINAYLRKMALIKTLKMRPELMSEDKLSSEDKKILTDIDKTKNEKNMP